MFQFSRITVLGSPGSGKSTFARRLRGELRLPLIQLDDLYWEAEWKRPTQKEWLTTINKALQTESFIMEGGYVETIECRIRQSQVVYLVEAPIYLCALRYLQRVVRIMRGDRSALPARVRASGGRSATPPGDLIKMLRKILLYRRQVRPIILTIAEEYQIPVRIIVTGTGADDALQQALEPLGREPTSAG